VFAPLAVGGLGFPDPAVVRHTGFAGCTTQVAADALGCEVTADSLPEHLPDMAGAVEAVEWVITQVAGPDAGPGAKADAFETVAAALRPGSPGVQRNLTRVVAEARAGRDGPGGCRPELEPDPEMRAIHRSGCGAESWTPYTLDHPPLSRLSSESFVAALTLRLGYPVYPGRTSCPICLGPAGPSTAHELTCSAVPKQGQMAARHKFVQTNVQKAAIRIERVQFSGNAPLYNTPPLSFIRKASAAASAKNFQADRWVVVTSAESEVTHQYAVDFTVAGVTQDNLQEAMARTGAMAELAERRKREQLASHWQIPPGRESMFKPFAVEVTGTFGPEARHLMGIINDAAGAEEAPDAPPDPDPHAQAAAASRRLWRMKAAVVAAALNGNAAIHAKYRSRLSAITQPTALAGAQT
jgi:hypothetical protein